MYLALVLLLASPAPSGCPTPTPVASASAAPSPRSSTSPQPTATPAPTQIASPGPCSTATTPTPSALPTATATAHPKPTPAPPAVRPYRQPLSFQFFTKPMPPSVPQSSDVGPVPQGTYRPGLPYKEQRVSEAIAEPGPGPVPEGQFPAAPVAAGLLLLLVGAHIRRWAVSPN